MEKKKVWILAGNKILLFLLGCVTNFAVLILGFWHWDMLGPAIHQSHLKTVWSWRAVQADRDTQKVEAWRTGFWKKDFKKANLILQLRDRHKQVNWILGSSFLSLFILVLSLYACIVDVAIMAFFQRIPCGVHCSYMKKNIYIYLSFFLVFYFSFSSCDSISVCDCLTMHPNGFNLVIACLIVEGTGN